MRSRKLLRCLGTLSWAAAGLWLLASVPAHAQLVGYWTFDGDALDSSGLANDATLNGNAGFSANVPGAIGGGMSLTLDGNGDYASVASNASLDSTVFTFSYWANQNGATQSGGFERLSSRGGDRFETAASNTGVVSVYNPSVGWNNTGQTLAASGWDHLSWRSDGTQVELYKNGNLVYTRTGVNFAGNPPTGVLNIGSRHNGAEGFQGLMDDVSLFNTQLNRGAIALMAGGTSATTIADSTTQQTIVSNTSDWSLSTVSADGGPDGTWNSNPLTLPGDATYTLTPTTPAVAGINTAAASLGGGAQPLAADNNIHFYRTTFDLDSFSEIAASLSLAVDNGAAVFINGEEIARETSFLTENWANPLPSLTIQSDGTIDGIVKFDLVDPSFSGFLPGENEIVLAVRNPNSEGNPAGGFAFRLDVASTAGAVPEPASIAMWSLLGMSLGAIAYWRRRKLRFGV